MEFSSPMMFAFNQVQNPLDMIINTVAATVNPGGRSDLGRKQRDSSI